MEILKPTFWKVFSVVVVIVGLVSTFLRFSQGLGATTNLHDQVPWGLWIGFDFIGVGLAAAGFTIAATVHVFNIHKYEAFVRPAILTAFLSYSVVVCLLIVDLGRPDHFWHPLVMWNHHSVMFEFT
ncbi:MAG: NrfD/PsrC family molybdoenzyme membrane anchor subunit, partial [Ignavibacteriaceae bacterium]|nr:NrfD/PsrC family molybdoenzyme membrane anchor subunit [Ignavibacteriaceae bacterium]